MSGHVRSHDSIVTAASCRNHYPTAASCRGALRNCSAHSGDSRVAMEQVAKSTATLSGSTTGARRFRRRCLRGRPLRAQRGRGSGARARAGPPPRGPRRGVDGKPKRRLRLFPPARGERTARGSTSSSDASTKRRVGPVRRLEAPVREPAEQRDGPARARGRLLADHSPRRVAHPRVFAAAAALQRATGAPVQANIYVTPPDERCVRPHADRHDVYARQVSGAKTWLVREARRAAARAAARK